SEVSADVRVESGRSGRLGAEVRPGSLSAIVDPRSEAREGKRSVQAEETSPFHQLPRARPSFWLLSERRRQEEPLGRGRQPTARPKGQGNKVSVQNGSIHQKDAVNDDDFEPYLSSQTNQERNRNKQ
uniref:YTH N6-methyladenosine RNA binding protein F3 n=1 Tax=Ovis aries TaxID=9940 RepID=A0AC11CRS6_SHEEP